MSSLSSSCKTALASSSAREHASDSVELILTPSGFVTHDQGQMLTSDLGLIEMTEAEYSDLQNFIHGRAEPQGGPVEDPSSRPQSTVVTGKDAANSTAVSPLTSTQAIDLSVSSDCLLTSVEKTPVNYGEVPGFVLARINMEDSPATPLGKLRRSSQMQFSSSARVCLEKRFNSMCPDNTRQPDIHPTLLSRKRIRLCCDELNTMVPFCDPCTDKVTTLTWTTTFLRYITKTYGDTFKEEFGKLFAHRSEIPLKSSLSPEQHPIQQEVNEELDSSLAAEQ